MKLHIDIDCFFVSAHRVGELSLQNIPLAVGSRSNLAIFNKEKQYSKVSSIKGAFTSAIVNSNSQKSFEEYFLDNDKKIRGIITTSSYEAREYGVKTAMSVNEALRLCPHLKVLPPEYPLYHHLSKALKDLLEKEIPLVEQFSIDEFFADLDGYIKEKDSFAFAVRLKHQIFYKLGLPVSIGIAKSKWSAKLATEFAKPNKVKIVYPSELEQFIKSIPIEVFPGVGKGYEKRLQKKGIYLLGQVKDKRDLFAKWGKNGLQLYNRILGIDNEGIKFKESKKSIGIGRSFDPISSREDISRMIVILSRHICFIALKDNYKPMTFALKVKYQYGVKSKGHVNANRLFNEHYLKKSMIELFKKIDIHKEYSIVQLNLTLSNFLNPMQDTLNLLHYKEDTKYSSLTDELQKLRNKYGIDIMKNGSEL